MEWSLYNRKKREMSPVGRGISQERLQSKEKASPFPPLATLKENVTRCKCGSGLANEERRKVIRGRVVGSLRGRQRPTAEEDGMSENYAL